MDCYYMGRCGGDAVLMAAEIGMLAKGAVDATLAVYDGLKAAMGIGSAGGGFRLVSIAGGGQTVLAPAGAAVAEGTVEGILGGVAEGSLSGFGFHTINDFLDNLAKIDADRVFGGEGGRPTVNGFDTTINAGKQGKHIVGNNNFIEGRSVFNGTVEDAQRLVDNFAGTGEWIGTNRERVNFGEVIGQYVNPVTNEVVDTTVGIIHYSKTGAHIVPAQPVH